METIIIYTTRTDDDIKFGWHAKHTLEEPDESRVWIDRAEYALPDGYTVARCNGDTLEIYNTRGKHCPLADCQHYWLGGAPCIVDIDANPWSIKLTKVRDLPW